MCHKVWSMSTGGCSAYVSASCRRTSPLQDTSNHSSFFSNPVALIASVLNSGWALPIWWAIYPNLCFLGEGRQKLSIWAKGEHERKNKTVPSPPGSFQRIKQGPSLYHGPVTLLRRICAEWHSVFICLTQSLFDGWKCHIMIMGTLISTAWLTFASTFRDKNQIIS